jgi:predicted MPP superfamily phosphohydrolase
MLDIILMVVFLLLVNGLPPLVAIGIHDRFGYPVDGGAIWYDGQPVFGKNKTIRGFIAGSLAGALAFPLLGLPWWITATAALLSMVGDLLSSFIKRRLAFHSGKDIVVLDQIFEALLPLLFLDIFLAHNSVHNIYTLLLFIVTAHTASRIWTHITSRPTPPDYPRTIKSSVRYREWKACHTPLAKWQVWFNLTSFLSDQILLTWFFKITGLYSKGEKNALHIIIEEKVYSFSTLPASFDGFRILFLTDLHLDGLHNITEKVQELLTGTQADICLIGGDIRMKTYGETSESISHLKKVMKCIQTQHGTFGVLGNHDCIEMLPELEDTGVVMLVNDAIHIEQEGAKIWIIGVDDPHYYKLHDATQAATDVDLNDFTIFLAHSPEAFLDAAALSSDLYLCGHTHGGQICFPKGSPIITNSRAPRHTASGEWKHLNMQGYTSRGVGPSSIPVRFNCPGEITLITLRKKQTVHTPAHSANHR